MRIRSVNRSRPRSLILNGREHLTGIAKEPVDGVVMVGPDGIDGDGVANTKDHGGPDQAVYLYGLDEYGWWADHAGLDPRPGLFGENLTVSALSSDVLEVGDHLTVGDVVLEVTAPRIPCGTLAARVGDGRFAAEFAAARRPGAYTRVLTRGPVTVGADIALRPGRTGVTLVDCMDAYYDPALPAVEVDRLLAAPIASRFRTMLQRRRDRS